MRRDETASIRTGPESRVMYYTIFSPRANSHDGTTARITLTLRRLSIRYLHQSLRRKPPARRKIRLAPAPDPKDALFRQRDEILVVTGDLREAACFPIRFTLLNPFARRRDKVPEQMARPVHHRATQQQQPGPPQPRAQCDAVIGSEQRHAAGVEVNAGDFDAALHGIGRAFLMAVRHRQDCARLQARHRRRTIPTA